MPSWLAPVWLDQSVRQGVSRWVLPQPGRRRWASGPRSTASRRTRSPTPSSWRKTMPGGCRRRPLAASAPAPVGEPGEAAPVGVVVAVRRARSRSPTRRRTSRRRRSPRSRVRRRHSPVGMSRSAIRSSEPFRKNTRRPSTSAGTSRNARTTRGHTSALSRPKAPAPQAAVSATRVMLSPLSEVSLKSGRMPASSIMVSVETTHTTITRSRALPVVRHRPTSACPSLCPFLAHPVTGADAARRSGRAGSGGWAWE